MRCASLVSIHAPTWGATSHPLSVYSPSSFQSTHPHGVRHLDTSASIADMAFQSTHPHGVRLTSREEFQRLRHCFNPRTHMGCDSTGLYISPEEVMFQSTHPHGVRRWTIALSLHKILFQSTHPHGVRPRRGAVSITA